MKHLFISLLSLMCMVAGVACNAHAAAILVPPSLLPGDTYRIIFAISPWYISGIESVGYESNIGYYNAYSGAVPPNLAQLDLARFLARFRDKTGFSEDAVNPLTFGYFTVLSTITAVEGLMSGSAAMARGERRGIPIAFNTMLVTIGSRNFMEAVQAMESAIEAAEAAA